MTQYFFHVRNGVGFVPDEEGQDLPDLAAAIGQAKRGIRSMLSEEVKDGRLDLGGTIEIADAAGAPVLVVSFGEAIAIRLVGGEIL